MTPDTKALSELVERVSQWAPRRRAPHEPIDHDWFEDRVGFDPFGGCWLWASGVKENGYGTATPDGRSVTAHRLSWRLYRGPIPAGYVVCHRCDVRCCVNPAHLFIGTHADNMADMRDKGRAWAQKNPDESRARGQRLKRKYTFMGADHPRARLTEADIRAIRSSQEKGVALAARYGVAEGTISQIRLRKRWTHVG